jgi:hypothetical protein
MLRAERPSACLIARTAVISLKEKKPGYKPTNYTLVFPEEWTKSQLLEYVRAVHPEKTAKIVKWNEVYTAKGAPVIWLTNPRAFSNYKKGEMK